MTDYLYLYHEMDDVDQSQDLSLNMTYSKWELIGLQVLLVLYDCCYCCFYYRLYGCFECFHCDC